MTFNKNSLSLKNLKVFIFLFILLILFELSKPSLFATNIAKNNQMRACLDIKTIGTSLMLFEAENYSYPTISEGLNALIINPDINKYLNHQQYIKTVPIDPWRNSYYYVTIKEGFEVFSFGGDGKSGGEGNNKDIFYPECTKLYESWLDKIFR